jgi:GT2 family glycosyltransferase
MNASIIIPSLNSPLIGQVIEHLERQSALPEIGEVLVVGKDDAGLVRDSDLIRFIDTLRPVSAPAARNIGLAEAKHDLFVFLDSDCLPDSNWLAEHMAAHRAGHMVVGGGVHPGADSYWALSYNLTLFHEFLSTSAAGPKRYLPTLNLSVERQAVEAAGCLDETLIRGQDIEWTIRLNQAGYPPYFWPQAAVEHRHNRDTFSRVWRDCVRSGYYMRRVRLHNPGDLEAPELLGSRAAVLLLSPLIAAWASARFVVSEPRTALAHWLSWPAIYLSKLAWCVGASRINPPG